MCSSCCSICSIGSHKGLVRIDVHQGDSENEDSLDEIDRSLVEKVYLNLKGIIIRRKVENEMRMVANPQNPNLTNFSCQNS
ncbi:hypothetical protein [Prochlorococcus marinus]|uniref:hypothetical protein n=1 Tax=Prochlorococcus marinus TaxID=1219 RepID=UPI0022B5A21B|nr:hypothetical protein [Prochlorococcus marinus]